MLEVTETQFLESLISLSNKARAFASRVKPLYSQLLWEVDVGNEKVAVPDVDRIEACIHSLINGARQYKDLHLDRIEQCGQSETEGMGIAIVFDTGDDVFSACIQFRYSDWQHG